MENPQFIIHPAVRCSHCHKWGNVFCALDDAWRPRGLDTPNYFSHVNFVLSILNSVQFALVLHELVPVIASLVG